MNLFQPSVKLIRTERKGSREVRRYDQPRTPLYRLIGLAGADPLEGRSPPPSPRQASSLLPLADHPAEARADLGDAADRKTNSETQARFEHRDLASPVAAALLSLGRFEQLYDLQTAVLLGKVS
jgi:hypothetical protein